MVDAPPKNAFEWSKAYFRSHGRSLHETVATMAALMTYADFKTLRCYPSQRTLAADTGLDVSTVKRHIRKNVDAGWLRKVKQGRSYQSATEYQLTVPNRCTGAPRSPMPPVAGSPVHITGGADATSTGGMDEPLTTHTTIHGTKHGSIHELDGPPWDVPTVPGNRHTTNQPTGGTGATSGGGTYDTYHPWSEDPFAPTPKRLDQLQIDPFAG